MKAFIELMQWSEIHGGPTGTLTIDANEVEAIQERIGKTSSGQTSPICSVVTGRNVYDIAQSRDKVAEQVIEAVVKGCRNEIASEGLRMFPETVTNN